MSIETILAQIDAEIARLTQVRKILASSGSPTLTAKPAKKAAPAKSQKRILSPDARKRIADAQKRRWAAQKARPKKDS